MPTSKTWKPKYSSKDYEIISESVEYKGHIELLNQSFRFKLFSGKWSPIVSRIKLNRRAAVVVLLYNPEDNTVVLVEQFRIGAIENAHNSPWILEPVAGLIEFGDTVEETAKREVKEESGCEVLDLIPMYEYLVSPGISNEKVYMFCGRINKYSLQKIHGIFSEGEDIKTHILPLSKAFKLLKNNQIVSALCIMSLQWLKINIKIVRGRWKAIN